MTILRIFIFIENFETTIFSASSNKNFRQKTDFQRFFFGFDQIYLHIYEANTIFQFSSFLAKSWNPVFQKIQKWTNQRHIVKQSIVLSGEEGEDEVLEADLLPSQRNQLDWFSSREYAPERSEIGVDEAGFRLKILNLIEKRD